MSTLIIYTCLSRTAARYELHSRHKCIRIYFQAITVCITKSSTSIVSLTFSIPIYSICVN